jgi:hypothetical protein
VIIATHNRWPLVREAVDSVLAQTCGLEEVIVVDDGSTDGTADLLEAHRPSVRLIRQPNAERGAARNHGLRRATGEFVVFLDSDDMLEEWFLSQFVERWRLHAMHNRIYVCPGQRWLPEHGVVTPTPLSAPRNGDWFRQSLRGAVWGIHSAIVPRSLAMAIGGFPEDRTVARSEDWVFQVKLLSTGVGVELLPRAAVRHRNHPGMSTSDDLACIAAAQSALGLLLREGLPGREMTDSERALAIAGMHRLCAAHAYHASQMRTARVHLREIARQLGWLKASAYAGRLWLQTWLGARGARVVRGVRQRVRETRWQRRRGASGAPGG